MELKNKRHQLFLQEYLQNGRNATKAYMAVYAVDNDSAEVLGHKLLRNVKIQDVIAEEDAKLANKFNITREFIANKLLEVIEDAELNGDRKNKIAALNSLTKMFGLDSPQKQEIEHKGILINFIKPE